MSHIRISFFIYDLRNQASSTQPTASSQASSTQPTASSRASNVPLLKLVMGSCYIPKEVEGKPEGDDAHFVCEEKQTFGVSDGVGGWAKKGIDAGEYSRQLIANALAAVKKEPHGGVDLQKVLNLAYSQTKAKGSATACIVTLKGQSLHAINIGDSGFRVVRQGNCVYKSPLLLHGFNWPYQLGNNNNCDSPSSAQVLEDIPVLEGDVIVAGTDGLFDNMFDPDIAYQVTTGLREGLEAQDMACKLAEQAMYNSFDKHNPSPYSSAAQVAGVNRHGGKVDDISVVVAYVASC